MRQQRDSKVEKNNKIRQWKDALKGTVWQRGVRNGDGTFVLTIEWFRMERTCGKISNPLPCPSMGTQSHGQSGLGNFPQRESPKPLWVYRAWSCSSKKGLVYLFIIYSNYSLCFRLCPFLSSHPWAPTSRDFSVSFAPFPSKTISLRILSASLHVWDAPQPSLSSPPGPSNSICLFSVQPRTGLSTPHVRIEKRKITSLVFNC